MVTHTHAAPVPLQSSAARARRLAYLTIGWNGLEAVVALWAAVTASSVALLGFGADSAIEMFSGAVVLWRFAPGDRLTRERRAAQLVGWGLLTLGGFVTADSVRALVQHREPATSEVGIVLTAASLVVMLVLARAKRQTALQTRSGALLGDASQSAVCAWLSAITVIGLACRATTGWWWVDPLAALVLVPFIVREGLSVWRAKSFDDACCNSRRAVDRPTANR
jgi:divalent metal cation (Fe/Co/Zn/Cd) transporter